jgi:phage-related protein
VSRTIVFYRTADGKCPVQMFLDSLSARAAQKITWVLSFIEDVDIVPAVYLKKLVGTEDIWECRVQSGSDAYRILCFFEGRSVVVLTHGIAKKSQKTPQREIARAESYRMDYLQRRVKK